MAAMLDIFNDDAEIIARLDECDRHLKQCPTPACPMNKALVARITELREALKMHLLL